AQMDFSNWPKTKSRFAEVFKTKTRAEWCQALEGTDVCFAPVLCFAETASHPHNKTRGTFIEVEGITQPGPAPRFSRSKPGTPTAGVPRGANTRAVLTDWGFAAGDIDKLKSIGVITA
ncbi:MAG: CoA transferase, partial [Alphaproteobacteria bacterium]|nr:CoA transferase [Alphaproteobacteria bacterium]